MLQPTPLPYNQVGRLTTEFYLSGAAVFLRHFPRRDAEAMLLLQAARICAPDWITADAIRPPAEITQTFTINSVAASLDRPFETIRRQTNRLVRDGIFEKACRGFALARSDDNLAVLSDYFRAMHDLLVRFVEDIVRTSDIPLACVQTPASIEPPLSAILIRALDLNLLPLGLRGVMSGSWQVIAIWNAIFAANIRHVTFDPEMSRVFVGRSPPTETRRPIAAKAIATALGLPYTTVWRHVRELHRRHLVERIGPDYVITEDNIRSGNIYEPSVAIADYALRKVRELVAAGFDASDAGAYYLGVRPPLVVLDR